MLEFKSWLNQLATVQVISSPFLNFLICKMKTIDSTYLINWVWGLHELKHFSCITVLVHGKRSALAAIIRTVWSPSPSIVPRGYFPPIINNVTVYKPFKKSNSVKTNLLRIAMVLSNQVCHWIKFLWHYYARFNSKDRISMKTGIFVCFVNHSIPITYNIAWHQYMFVE